MPADVTRRIDLGEGVVIVVNLVPPLRAGTYTIAYPLAVRVRGRSVDVPRYACLALHPDPGSAEKECVERVLACLRFLLEDPPDGWGEEPGAEGRQEAPDRR